MYEAHFGLSIRPFQISPDPRMLFPSQTQQRALSYIEYGLHQSDGFVVVTGEPGVGKSILLRSLHARLNPAKATVATILTPQLNGDDIIRMLAHQFGCGCPGASKADLIMKLVGFFTDNAQQNKRNILLLDEAHKATTTGLEELRLLTELQADYRPLLQIVLFAQAEFRTVLRRPEFQALRQRIISSFHLGQLEQDEVPTYIQHRLKRAQWIGNPHFEIDALIDVFELTEGIPRRINILMDRVLLSAFIKKQTILQRENIITASLEIENELTAGEHLVPA